ncbi:MAG: phosphoribosylglycinamide formyltransferase 1 [Parcubacteria group bacterium Gr01-1014_8]|nr:MAG: phosphoribosylglycinamide formyltransferase 1 [Parcubacteria group bacterium Gr01-1014_8]
MSKPKLLIFASGTKIGGGSGFENLVQASRSGALGTEIVGVVSNHENGGVRERADRLGVPFIYFGGPWEAEHYQRVVKDSGAEWVMLSGWLKFVKGLDPMRTFNIHPALLSFDHGRFGGPGMYGHHIHEAVAEALEKGEITNSGCSMHFTTEEYDRGPIFFEYRVPLEKGMTAETIAKVVQAAEHEWQPKITNMVVHELIRWDGKDANTLVVPKGYSFLPNHDAVA